MAVSESIRAALDHLVEEMLVAKLTADTFSTLQSQIHPPPSPLIDDNAWVFVVSRLIERLVDASEKLEEELNRSGLPLLKEMEEMIGRR